MQILGLAQVVALISGLMAGCERDPSPPASRHSEPAAQDPWFEDIGQRTGFHFLHDAGPQGRYQVPDQMGSGVAMLDFNLDGWLDLFLIQNGGPDSGSRHRLFRQEADGSFKDVSEGSGLDVAGHGMGVAVGDINNDGWPDLLLTEYGGIRLFLNQTDGTFLDRTVEVGLDNPRWGTSAAFFDYDRDGWLDLVVGNYLDYNSNQECFDAAGAPEFCGPHGFPGLAAKLYHNQNGKRFEDVSVVSGIARIPGPALGVVCADFDGDHWPDVFFADDGRPNRLFINQRDGTFQEEAAIRGLAYNAMGQTAGDMGIALGDVNQDGLFDLFVTHLSEEHHSLWKQGPRGLFQDVAATHGLNVQGWRGTGFGTALADFDQDGDLDLAFVNGRVKRARTVESVAPGVGEFWAPYAQCGQVFENTGSGMFRDVSGHCPAFCGQAVVGRGLACGDLNNDGALELLVTSTGGPAKLFGNVASGGGHWLVIRVVDPSAGGRDAYGAEVWITAGGRRWWRLVQPAYGYLSSSDPRVHIGLGPVSAVEGIRVMWPDGSVEEFPGGAADQFLVLSKGGSKAAE